MAWTTQFFVEPEYDNIRTLYAVKCKDGQASLLQQNIYKNGYPIKSQKFESNWNYVAPETRGGTILGTLCGTEKKNDF